MLLVLLMCAGGVLAYYVRDDIGAIPYEQQGLSGEIPQLGAKKDYGDIQYEKDSVKSDDFGDIQYEGKKASPKAEYGDIPYDKVTAGPTTINIPEIVQALLGGRDVPNLMKMIANTSVARLPGQQGPTRTSRLLALLSNGSESTTGLMKVRADEEETEGDFIDYQSPVTIDDWWCNPKIHGYCSTCTDRQGYRVYCLSGTTTKAPGDLDRLISQLVYIMRDYEDYSWPRKLTYGAFSNSIYAQFSLGWPHCHTTTSTTETPTPTYAPHNLTGQRIARCYVCGMLEPGIPHVNQKCIDPFMAHGYKMHCMFLNSEDWLINGSTSKKMWGRWTGGCSLRLVHITDQYTQRTCRNNVEPALGASYVSRRLAKLEYSLRRETDACASSPSATLVPLSRGVSLYSQFTVCVCSRDYCNRAGHAALTPWTLGFLAAVVRLRKPLLT